MRKTLLCLWTFILVLTAMESETCAADRNSPHADRHVILITIDGFPARMWLDEALPAPNLRRLAREGAAADAMTVSNPSVTWINHTTLITGVTPRRHGVLFNGLLVRQGLDQPPKVEPWVDKTRLVLAPTLYDLAAQAGLTTGEVDWVAVTRAENIHWSFPEIPTADGKVEQEMIAAGVLRPDQIDWFHGKTRKNMSWHDEMWTKAAGFIFAKHHPNLLLYHQLNPDTVNHQCGPTTTASYTAMAYADRLVGDLLQVVDQSGLGDRTTIIVASDHGFKKVAKVIYPNVTLKQAGHLAASGASITRCEVVVRAGGGMAFVYVLNPVRKTELLPGLKKLFSGVEGVAKVLDGQEGPSVGMPTPEENQGMGDLILFAKAGYAFKSEVQGEAVIAPTDGYLGTHGYLADDPELDGIFIASGPGIKPGVKLGRIANLDVAPTIARLLGLTIPNAEGRVLSEILDLK